VFKRFLTIWFLAPLVIVGGGFCLFLLQTFARLLGAAGDFVLNFGAWWARNHHMVEASLVMLAFFLVVFAIGLPFRLAREKKLKLQRDEQWRQYTLYANYKPKGMPPADRKQFPPR
jgi:hypothetical protein